ncbi:MAG: hypothetical protein U0892_06925 [Pirellulales bacterium]
MFNDKDKAAAGKPPSAPRRRSPVVPSRRQLQGLPAAMMVVNAGGQPVQVELDPAVAIVTAHDLTFLQQGERSATQALFSSNKPDWVEVEKIDIVAEEVDLPHRPATPYSSKLESQGRRSERSGCCRWRYQAGSTSFIAHEETCCW